MGSPIFSGALTTYGAQLSAYGARTAVVLGANENALLAKGWWRVQMDAGTKVQFTYNAGSNYVDEVAASAVGTVFSDGTSTRILAGAGGGTAQIIQIKAAF